MLYTPPAFRSEDRKLAMHIARRNPFALLVTTADGQPLFSHVPLLLEEASALRVVGHVARANPQRRHLAAGVPATAIFQGPHAYVSPRWYEPAPDNVPTWNYAVLHVHGVARALHAEDEAWAALERLVRSQDPAAPLALAAAERRELLRGITAFELTVERFDLKLKLSQNRSAADRLAVATELLRSPREAERATGLLMLERSEEEPTP